MPSTDLSWLVGELRALSGDLDVHADRAALVIAIDQGGHASRALAFDTRGRMVAEAFAPINTFRSGSDRVEHDPADVEGSIRAALDDLHRTLAGDAERVAAAGLATQRSSIVCWDTRTGAALSPILSWQDRRNASLVERLWAHEDRVRERTGLVLNAHYGASKLRWCLDELSTVRASLATKTLKMGPLAAWLMRSLLRERPNRVDAVNAARTQLLDIAVCDWSSEMLDLFGVPVAVLPAVAPNRQVFGHIDFGGRPVPLLVSTGDQSAMPFAHGPPDPSAVYLNIGTGAFVQRVSETPVPEGLLRSVIWLAERDAPPLHSIEGTVNGAGSAIDWLDERIAANAHRVAAGLTRTQVETLSPPLFLNGVGGVGSPFWRARFEPRFIGEGTELERVAAVVESIAFLICENIDRMRAGAGRIIASGGLSSSDYLCECVAALSGLPLERSRLQEATACGLAFLVADDPLEWSSHGALERFEPRANAALSERRDRWRAAMG